MKLEFSVYPHIVLVPCHSACPLLFPYMHIHVRTEPAPSGSPGGLSVRHKLPTTAELHWSPIAVEKQNGVITGYTVKVVGPDSPREIPVQGACTTSVEIPGLRPFTSYSFNISAMTKVGIGPASTVSSKTLEGGEISILYIIYNADSIVTDHRSVEHDAVFII